MLTLVQDSFQDSLIKLHIQKAQRNSFHQGNLTSKNKTNSVQKTF